MLPQDWYLQTEAAPKFVHQGRSLRSQSSEVVAEGPAWGRGVCDSSMCVY